MTKNRSRARLALYLGESKALFAGGLATMIAVTACNLGGPLVLRSIIDDAVPSGRTGLLLGLALLYLGLVAVSGALTYVQMIVVARLGLRIVTEIKKDVFSHLLTLPVPYFDEHPVGELMARTESDAEKVKALFSSAGISLAVSGLLLVGMLAVCFALEPGVTLWIALCLPPVVAAIVFFYDRLRPMYDRSRRLWAGITASITEFVQGVELLRAFGRTGWARDRLDRAARELRDNDARAGFLEVSAMGGLGFLVGPAFMAAVMVLVSPKILAGAMSLGTLLVFLDYGARLFDPVMGIAENVRVIQQSRVSLGRIFGILALEPEGRVPAAAGRGAGEASSVVPVSFASRIEFRGVWFAYKGEDWVLEDLAFEMPIGSQTALVGPSGSGKTTTVGLLCRFYRPQRGRILVDGRPLDELDLAAWRRKIGLVLQDSYLFPGTVLENVRVYDDRLAEERVRAALDSVQAGDLLGRLPGGLGAELRERGANLSSGEKQLLSFARAVAFGPEIVVLDEATASIDVRTERRVKEGMDRLLAGRTSLVVAHRLSSVMGADQILYFREGRVVARGRHAELMATFPDYAALVRLQFLGRGAESPAAACPEESGA